MDVGSRIVTALLACGVWTVALYLERIYRNMREQLKVINAQRADVHQHKIVPVAARPGYELARKDEHGVLQKLIGTLVLYRCECGLVNSNFHEGQWTAEELGIAAHLVKNQDVDDLLRRGGFQP